MAVVEAAKKKVTLAMDKVAILAMVAVRVVGKEVILAMAAVRLAGKEVILDTEAKVVTPAMVDLVVDLVMVGPVVILATAVAKGVILEGAALMIAMVREEIQA